MIVGLKEDSPEYWMRDVDSTKGPKVRPKKHSYEVPRAHSFAFCCQSILISYIIHLYHSWSINLEKLDTPKQWIKTPPPCLHYCHPFIGTARGRRWGGFKLGRLRPVATSGFQLGESAESRPLAAMDHWDFVDAWMLGCSGIIIPSP